MFIDNDKGFLTKVLTFWDKLDPRQKELILNNTRNASFKKAQNIHNGEDDCVGVILVKKGELRSYILSENGKDITLYRFSRGDICILSSSCMFEGVNFDIFVDAERDSEVLIIDSNAFDSISKENIYAENFSLRKTVDRFSDVMVAMEEILFYSIEKRLANFLVNESYKIGKDTLSITHEDIAKYIGSAREVVSRTLKSFENKGIISLSRGKVKVEDKSKIEELLKAK